MSRQMEKQVEDMLSESMVREQRRLMGLEPTLPTLEEARSGEPEAPTSKVK